MGFFVPSRGQNRGQNPFVALPRMAEYLEFFDRMIEPRDGFELPVPRQKSRGFPQHSGHYGVSAGRLNDTA